MMPHAGQKWWVPLGGADQLREVRKSKRGSGAMDGEVMACIRDRSLTTRDSLL